MDARDPREEGTTATIEFERELESLLMEAFAEGATVEGTWKIGDSTEAIPEWTIEIVKTANANASYDPEFVE